MATAPAPASTPSPARSSDAPTYGAGLAILTSLFFLWGFLTCLNDILIPHLKAAFSLTYTQAALVQFAFFTAYALVSLPAGALVKRLGYQRGIVVGLVTAAVGCVLFYPAASTRAYPLFLGALFVLAAGITVLQVSANPYVAVLGPPATASARLTLTQAFNSLGTTVAPWFGSVLILGAARRADEAKALSGEAAFRAAEAASVQVPYLGLAGVLGLIAVAMAVLRLPEVRVAGDSGRAGYGSVLRERHLVLGALAIFVYVGGEVSIGSFLVNFMALPDVGGLKDDVASRYLALYWGGAMIGRFVGAGVLGRYPAGRVLAVFAGIAGALCLATMALHGPVAMGAILAVGLFNSILFPTIFTLAVDGLGEGTEYGSAVLCTAIVGGALVPVLMGRLADTIGIQMAFFLPALCYAYIVHYGLVGSRRVASPSR